MKGVIGRHVVETAGARVLIDEDGPRLETALKGETMFGCMQEMPPPGPMVLSCPVRRRLYGIEEETGDSVLASVRENIQDYGMFTGERRLEDDARTVTFGASEIIADAMKAGMVDCAVMTCDGAGTVLLTRPEVVRAVGAHMTGMVSTSPIEATIEGLRERGAIILNETAAIDQLGGVLRAMEEGFKSIAATVVGRESHLAHQMRVQAGASDVELFIFSCHNTGVCAFTAEILAGFSDVIYACASRPLRELIGPRAKMQMGSGVPVFAMTDAGKRLMLNSAVAMSEPLLLLKRALPDLGPGQPDPLH